MKIGMYTDEEILEHLTEGEGRGFLGRSMYDAIIGEIERLNKDLKDACEVIERLKEDKKKAIELLKNSDIDLDDKLIIDLRDFSSYTLDTIINLLQGSDKE